MLNKNSFILGDCVDIFRCQSPIERTFRTQSGDWNPGNPDNLSVMELPGNHFLCPLVRVDDIDPETGFVQIGDVPDVEIKITDRKVLLRKNDILMSYIGNLAKLALVGYIEEEKLAISGKNLLVLRAHSLDQIWLFYFLRQKRVRNAILAPLMATIPEIMGRREKGQELKIDQNTQNNSSNNEELLSNPQIEKVIRQQVFSLSIEKLRSMSFTLPQDDEIQSVTILHNNIISEVAKIKAAKQASKNLGKKIATLLELATWKE